MFKRVMEYKFIVIAQEVDTLVYNGNELVFRPEAVSVNVAKWYFPDQTIRDIGEHIKEIVRELQPVIDLWNYEGNGECVPQAVRELIVNCPGEYDVTRRVDPADYGLEDDDGECPF